MRSIVKLVLAILTTVFIISSCSSGIDNKDALPKGLLRVHFIDVGQGDSILVQANGKIMLIDTGHKDQEGQIMNYLKSLGIKSIDYFILTHPHNDHIGNAPKILKTYNIENIFMPDITDDTKAFNNTMKEIEKKGHQIKNPVPGMEFDLGEAVCTMLAPNGKQYQDINDYSIVIRMTYKNTSFMFTGDAMMLSESEMIDKGYDLSANVLKIGRHGNDTSTSEEFLDKVNPQYAVISCGLNDSKNHPSKATMKKLKERSIIVYRTDENGTIVCTSDGDTITFDKDPGSYKQGKKSTTDDTSSFNSENPDSHYQPYGVIDELIKSMSLEEKVGQLFIAAFRKNNKGKSLTSLDEAIKQQIEKYNLGGVILFKENIDTATQTYNLIADMQSTSKIPMFISVDEEGGRISRIGNNSKMGITKLPSAEEIGRVNDPDHTYRLVSKLGRDLYDLGFNMNFAPIADVNTNPKNPVIGDRSFGSDPEKVGLMVEEFTKALQDNNVSAVLKHFPGHGDTSLDSHKGEVVIKHDIERLRKIELIPFKGGIIAGADAIMTAHIIIPEIEDRRIPATLSEKILTGLLRDELSYNGLIITDALEMKAIKDYWSCSQASVMAFKAGADILLMPDSLDEAYNSILSSVIKGEISEERLNESVRRILEVKLKRKVLKS